MLQSYPKKRDGRMNVNEVYFTQHTEMKPGFVVWLGEK